MKSQWSLFDINIRSNIHIFYDDYTDIQRYVFLPLPHFPNNSVRNAAKANILGGDLDLLVVPWSFLDLEVQYTYIETEYDEYMDPDYGDLSEGAFPNTPKHQVSVTPGFHLELPGNWGRLSAKVPWFYQSEIAITVNNEPNGNENNDVAVPGSIKGSITRTDVRLDWRDIFGPSLSAGFYVRNIFDKEFDVGGSNTMMAFIIGVNSSIYSPPRTYSLELRYDF